MKQSLLVVIVSFILAACFSPVSAQMPAPSATINTGTLNVRSGPGTNYAVLTRVRRGEVYLLSGRNAASTWWQINVNGLSGWVSGRYIKKFNAELVAVIGESPCTRYIAPACPDSQTTTAVTTQSFERGLMLWRGDNREIYILLNSGTFLNYTDAWNGQALTPETPPAGFVQPQMGFGYLWQTGVNVRQMLGWAFGGELAYTTPVETSNGTSPRPSDDVTYLRLADGRSVVLNYYADSWAYVN